MLNACFYQKHTVCEMWKRYGTARWATDDDMVQCMGFACWITKDTDTCSYYVILLFYVTRTRLTTVISNKFMGTEHI